MYFSDFFLRNVFKKPGFEVSKSQGTLSWVDVPKLFFATCSWKKKVMQVRMTNNPWVISAESRTQGWPQLSTSRPWDARRKEGQFCRSLAGKDVGFFQGYVSFPEFLMFLFEHRHTFLRKDLLEPSKNFNGRHENFYKKNIRRSQMTKRIFFVDPWHLIWKLQKKFL